MAQSINEIQDGIIEEFSVFEDINDKIQYLIDLGNDLETMDESARTAGNLIEGCQASVWLDASLRDGRVYYSADSNAIITKGMISLLLKVFNGHTPQEILSADLYFVDRVGLRAMLNPTRANGLHAMIKQIRLYALAFDAKQKQSKPE